MPLECPCTDRRCPPSLPSMFIDSATLQDLEIVPMLAVRGTTLWSLVSPDGAPLGRPRWATYCGKCSDRMRRLRRKRVDRSGILALAHRGVIHVRGKDCVHP